MNFDQLRYFKAAAEEENFGRASQHLHITQQGLSANIIKLENELGVYLFDRIGRQIFLNEQGKIFLHYTNMLLKDLDDAKKALHSNKNESARQINISTTVDNVSSLIITGFLSCHNGIQFSLEVIDDKWIPFTVMNHNVHFVISSTPYSSPETKCHLLCEHPFAVVVNKNHPLSDCTEVSFEDIKDEKFALSGETETFRKDLDSILRKADFEPNVILASRSSDSILRCVQNGNAISIFGIYGNSTLYSEESIYGSSIKFIPISDPVAKRKIYILWRKGALQDSHLKQFLEYARNGAAGLIENPLM